MTHPNKRQFVGIVGFVDTPSDKPPDGALGHKIVLRRKAVEQAIADLVGMGVCSIPDLDNHMASQKIGVVTKAYLLGRRIVVRGWLYARDCSVQVESIQACTEPLGMSYEIASARVDDVRRAEWEVSKFYFTGAAILRRDKAACKGTRFWMEKAK